MGYLAKPNGNPVSNVWYHYTAQVYKSFEGKIEVERSMAHNMDSITTIKRGLFLVSMEVLAKSWQKLAILIKVDLKVPLKKKSVSLIFDLFLEK